jgi:hypothetical protein
MIVDILVTAAQSTLFLWSTFFGIVLAILAARILRKRKSIPLPYVTENRGRHFLIRASPIGIVLLGSMGLLQLLQPIVTFAEYPPQHQRSQIDAVYLLDVSGSMGIPILSERQADCLDWHGVLRVKNDGRSGVCIAINTLEKLLQLNEGANVAVILFGGGSVVVGPAVDHESIMNAVWFNWEKSKTQSFTNATDITQALKQALGLLKGKTAPIIIASDFGDFDSATFFAFLSRLKTAGMNIAAVAIGFSDYNLSKVQEAIGEQFVFPIRDRKDIENISVKFNKSSREGSQGDNYRSGVFNFDGGLSNRVVLGMGMLTVALVACVVLMRPIRWPGGEQ